MAASLGVALSWSSSSLANGRFPAADQLVVDPDDTSHLVLRATFGLLESRDGGQRWSWTCEAAVGYVGDPAIAVLRGGGVLAGFFDFVSVSRDAGCAWSSTKLDARYRYAIDATLDVADPSRAWVVAGSVDGSLTTGLLLVNADGAIEQVLDLGGGFVPVTVEVAPSDADRIYVSGLIENTSPIVLRSEDRGLTWQRFDVSGTPALPLFISAVDPSDPARVYARLDGAGATVASAVSDPSDHVLLSTDAGETWRTVFSVDADLLGFALSPDGQRIAVGAPGRGIYSASTADLDFQPVGQVVIPRCLRWVGDSLFACGQENMDGWTLARSRDAGLTFEPVWHQQELEPLDCSPSSTVCQREWPDIARSIQADPGVGVTATTGAIAAAGAAPMGAGVSVSDGRGCALGGGPRGQSGWTVLVAAVAGVVGRQRCSGRPGRRRQ
jgi:photosystem II stability/assembly factor-like uncharacterized protein